MSPLAASTGKTNSTKNTARFRPRSPNNAQCSMTSFLKLLRSCIRLYDNKREPKRAVTISTFEWGIPGFFELQESQTFRLHFRSRLDFSGAIPFITFVVGHHSLQAQCCSLLHHNRNHDGEQEVMPELLYFSKIATAIAAIPSPRPTKPMRSFVVALIPISPGSRPVLSASCDFMAAR